MVLLLQGFKLFELGFIFADLSSCSHLVLPFLHYYYVGSSSEDACLESAREHFYCC